MCVRHLSDGHLHKVTTPISALDLDCSGDTARIEDGRLIPENAPNASVAC